IVERRPRPVEALGGDRPVDGELDQKEADAGQQIRRTVNGAVPGPEKGELKLHTIVPSREDIGPRLDGTDRSGVELLTAIMRVAANTAIVAIRRTAAVVVIVALIRVAAPSLDRCVVRRQRQRCGAGGLRA